MYLLLFQGTTCNWTVDSKAISWTDVAHSFINSTSIKQVKWGGGGLRINMFVIPKHFMLYFFKVCTSTSSWLFYFKSSVVVYKGKSTKKMQSVSEYMTKKTQLTPSQRPALLYCCYVWQAMVLSCSRAEKNTSRSKEETDNTPTDKTEQVTSGMKQSLSFQI